MARKQGRLPRPDHRPPPLPIKEGEGRGHYTQWAVPPTPKPKSKEPDYLEDAEMSGRDFSENPTGAEEQSSATTSCTA